MEDTREEFYRETLSEWIPDRNASVIAIAGGSTDFEVLTALGFSDVTMSNVDARFEGRDFSPFRCRVENAESLNCPDGSFDYAVVHASLHHMSSPHRGLTEMYRVARRGVIVFEARDSASMRLLERLALTQTYEHQAVHHHKGKAGGVNNTQIPNYIYRWTEREIEKTISSYAPTAQHRFLYRYKAVLPSTDVDFLRRALVTACRPFYALYSALLPKQRNLFAVFIEKPGEEVFPWLTRDNGSVKFNTDWGRERYPRLDLLAEWIDR